MRRDHIYRYLTEQGNVAANRDRAFLSAVYTHLLNAGVIRGDNPCAGLRYRNTEKPRNRYLTDGEFQALVASLPRKLALMAQWSYLTGMRQSEMLAMRLIDASEEGVSYVPVKGRLGKDRDAVLIRWTDELRQVWKEAAGLRIGAQPLFPDRHGNHYTRHNWQAYWQPWKLKAAIPNLRWHDIRRKTGSDSATLGEASERLSHADQGITRRHYRAKPKVITPLK